MNAEKIQYIKNNFDYHVSEYDLIMDLLDNSLYTTSDLKELLEVCKVMNLEPTKENIQEAINDWNEANES